MFIVSVAQHMKIGDLSHSGLDLSSDAPSEALMDTTPDEHHIPEGIETGDPLVLSRQEERALTRDSTAGFAGGYLFTLNI